jgi:hypothetical protein
MFQIPLNKFEKEKRVIELHLQGKTISEIAKEVHMSFRDISKLIKSYDKKTRIQQNKKDDIQSIIKKPSLSSQAFVLFQEGKNIDEVKVLLDIPFKKAMQFWVQYLKSIRMFEAFEFYQENSYDISTFLSIKTYMNRNNVSGNDILQVLRGVTDLINLRTEIERLKQIKNNYSLNQNTNSLPLLPLGLPKYYYNY